jgi:ADP-heptose:LPS heptosyltransferase
MDEVRILVIRPGALGDTVLTEPVVASLRAQYPSAQMELAGRMEYLPLLVGPGRADACCSMDGREFTSLFADGRIQLRDFDVVVAFLSDEDGKLRQRMEARFPRVVVHDPRPGPGEHVVDCLLRALEPLGVPAVRRVPRAECRPEWTAAAADVLGGRRNYVVIHPGSGGRTKLWQAEKWTRRRLSETLWETVNSR